MLITTTPKRLTYQPRRRGKHGGLSKKQQRYPLVVAQLAVAVDVGRRYDVIEWQIIRAGDPADAVGVRLMVVGEPSRDPAMDAFSHELPAAYDDAEDD